VQVEHHVHEEVTPLGHCDSKVTVNLLITKELSGSSDAMFDKVPFLTEEAIEDAKVQAEMAKK
jgi:hypothetical protein